MTNTVKLKPAATTRHIFQIAGASLITLLMLLGPVVSQAQHRRGDSRDPDMQDQDNERRDYDRADNGVRAGGKWMEYGSEDRMTAAKRVRFELSADNAEDSVDQARVILYCTDGKLKLADFRPNVRLGRPDWPGFWGQPQIRVRVRADNAHDDHSWNWVNGHFLAMDKGTARELIGAHLFRIEFQTPDGPRIAEFSPAGLDLNRVHEACGLEPKRH
jgi:hypothetical protein